MLSNTMAEIQESLREGGEWCDLEKAHTLAAIVAGLRPRVICEIGVWMGGSLVPMAIAARSIATIERATGRAPEARRVVAIDPWMASESCAGQAEADVTWWRSVDHDAALAVFRARLDHHGVRDLVEIVRLPSGVAPVPDGIGLLHVDGNHAEQAVRDVERFGPAVSAGGILVLDDLSWSGGHVAAARDAARAMGFATLYPLGTGVVMQRAAEIGR
jgi:predicted O-methyltransferase YrrM